MLIASAFSWALFRTQLLADQNGIREKLASLSDTQTRILERIAQGLSSSGNQTVLQEIQRAVDRIDSRLHGAIPDILKHVNEQQSELATKIQTEFEKQSEASIAVVKEAFSSEVRKVISDTRKQDKLVKGLLDAFASSFQTMGSYQRANIEDQSK
ncbi:MAG: hypothetical protein AAF483_21170, partial [Planctomycetota bacterium]